ncbi:MAG: hypothetical protein L3K26_10700, partial [Candidatus Hydrogenedentes bacterium]|nr:hypothetical protein [Candidatus Hydrogenedentota bacterium]
MYKKGLLFSLSFFLTLAVHGAPQISPKSLKVSTYSQELRTAYTTADGLPSDDVRAIVVTESGDVYAGTAAGLAKWAGEQWVPVAGMPANPVHALLAVGDTLYVAAGNQINSLKTGKFSLLVEALPAPATSLIVDTAG